MKNLVCVFLLVFILVEMMYCEGCWKQEREALVALNSGQLTMKFYNPNTGDALSWGDNPDCCEWIGVECNTTTGRVTKLHIELNIWPHSPHYHLNYSDFLIFKDLKTLDLSNSDISNCTGTLQGNLEVLKLSPYSLDNDMSILSCLDGLSSLKSLSLAGRTRELKATSFHTFQKVLETISSKLLHLEVLDIGGNNLTNEILPSLRGFRSLKELYLSGIGLDSDLHFQGLCATLKNLEILDISFNNFNDTDIASALSGLSSLKTLYLQESKITLRSIHKNHGFGFAWPSSLQVLSLSQNSLSNNILSYLSGLPLLRSLDLSGNDLKGSLDISGLSILTNLKILDFSNNQLVDLVGHKGSTNLSRLEILALDWNTINGSNLEESLRAFPSIRNLTLTQNKFKGKVLARGFHSLRNLELLTLDGSYNLENEFFKSIGDLPSLKVLSMWYCEINGTLPTGDWFKLKKLEVLDLSGNKLVGKLPSSFFNMTSLGTLKLTNNYFIGNIGPNIASFTSLEYLNFEGNQFEFPISFTQFSNHSNLKFVYGNGNKVILDSHSTWKTWVPKFQLEVLELSSITQAKSIPLPSFLIYQYNLTYVDFTDCKLGGEFPKWLLENNTKMERLILQNCSFVGDFHLPSRPRLSMVRVDVSNNEITCQMLSDMSSIFPNLVHLNMSRNEIYGSIPYQLRNLSTLETLDLSYNQFYGEIPYNLTRERNRLTLLSFSSNNLHGLIPPMLSVSPLQSLFLDNNNLSGSIPSNFFNSCVIQHVDISNNNFIGKIPSQMTNCTMLVELSMYNNHFEGPIPSELAKVGSITFLDLSQNNLSGCVPSFVGYSASSIHLSNNKLSCLSKHMFRYTSSLVTLDLSNNEIISEFPDLIHGLQYTGLSILLLKGNRFRGNIPKQLCRLTDLTILDLSYNSFVGEIPSCLGKMPFEIDPQILRHRFNIGPTLYRVDYNHDKRFGKEKANFTSKERSETYTTNVLIYMSGIDLSHNKLNGSIPSELGNLTRIRALNLSNNFLTGKIPTTFSNLVLVESLDLSFNMLSGQIPPQLSGLNFLEVFTVAHNNLSGSTPEWKAQFSTFDESSYEGNQFLCGPPLPRSCNVREKEISTLPNGLNMDRDDDSLVDMYVFRVSFIVAYTSILLVIATVLYINPYWRQAWLYYVELVVMNCYYFIRDNLC